MKKRDLNCDLLRILAFTFVVAVHSLGQIGFYVQVTDGPTMFIINVLRCLFITCVPLFLVLSGYLISDNKFDKKYCKKIIRVLLTYILCSFVCIAFKSIIQNNGVDVKRDILSIFSYTGAPYSWYVNLYIGMFLLFPFLNVLWEGLANQKQKKNLLIVLFVITILPSFFNIYNFDNLSWFLKPSSNRVYYQLVPNYLVNLYPILYFYVGKYLREFGLKISVKRNVVSILILLLLFGAFNYYRNYGELFEWASYVDYFSFECFAITILLSNLILKYFKFDIKNGVFRKLVIKLSYLTFGAYLLSYIFDSLYYPLLQNYAPYLKDRLILLLPMILLVSASSLLLAWLVDLFQSLSVKIFSKIVSK